MARRRGRGRKSRARRFYGAARKAYRRGSRAVAAYRARSRGRVMGTPAKVSLAFAAAAPVALPAVDAVVDAMGLDFPLRPANYSPDVYTRIRFGLYKWANGMAEGFGLARPFKTLVGTYEKVDAATGIVTRSVVSGPIKAGENAGWAIPVAVTAGVHTVYDRIMGIVAGARVRFAGVTWVGGPRRK